MKVVEWIADSNVGERECSVGWLGGWFKDGMRWDNYIALIVSELREYLEAIRVSVIENKIRYSGETHQHGGTGVPVFDDGTVGQFSYRAWGDLMAAIWSTEENHDYGYMDFYMRDYADGGAT